MLSRPALTLTLTLGLAFGVSFGLVACGDEPCPAGTAPRGDGCAPVDAGPAADAGPRPDGGARDGSARDGGAGDACVASTFLRDGDEDGFGDGDDAVTACAPPPGYALVPAGDCDDADDAVNPAAAELCDGVDQDCDLAIDEGRLAFAGDPIFVGEHGRGSAHPQIDAYAGGFVVAWRGDADARWRRLDAAGAPSTPEAAVDAASAAQGQDGLALAVVDPGTGGERALVAWAETSGRLRARALRLDGTSAPASVTIAAGDSGALATRITVLPWGPHALVVWAPVTASGEGRLRAALLDGGSAMPLEAPLVLVERAAVSFFAPPGVTRLADGSVLVPAVDAAAGSLVALRVVKEGTSLREAERATLPATRSLAGAQSVALGGGGGASVVFSTPDAMGLELTALALGPLRADGGAIGAGEAMSHFLFAAAGTLALGLRGDVLSASSAPLVLSQLDHRASGPTLAQVDLATVATRDYAGADLVQQSPALAWLVEATDVGGSPDVRVRRLACR